MTSETQAADTSETGRRTAHPYPFAWGDCWKHCTEYTVDDFESEALFFGRVLGFPMYAYGPDSAMFTSPDQAFFVNITRPAEGSHSTPANAMRLQFMIQDIIGVTEELERRGIVFEQRPAPYAEGSPLYVGAFRTPHGIPIDLWGMTPMTE